MRKLLITAAIAAVASATPAFAADTQTTQVTAFEAARCDILEQSSSIALGAVNEEKDGNFKFTCNFEGYPELTFTSANGGVKYSGVNGEHVASYGIWLNDQAPSSGPNSWLQSDAAQGGVAYPNIAASAPPNSIESPVFRLALTEALPVAGEYSDTLTISINP